VVTQNQSVLKPLTDQQERILDYIRGRVRHDGMPPTHDEIKEQFGLKSAFGVRQHLRLLQSKRRIEICPGKSRGIRILPENSEDRCGLLSIPIVGRIAAGQPILAEENLDGSIEVGDDLFPGGVLFALRVEGSSMVKAGINTGDMAVIRQQPAVENGQIAAVLRGNEATLKRWYAHDDYVCLAAENDDIPDIRVEKGSGIDVRVLGLYVGLIRRVR
jgi:repressor LexA